MFRNVTIFGGRVLLRSSCANLPCYASVGIVRKLATSVTPAGNTGKDEDVRKLATPVTPAGNTSKDDSGRMKHDT